MRQRTLASFLVVCALACDNDDTTGPDVPSEVRSAPSTVVIAGIPVGVTGIAYREFAASGAAVGNTHWLARVVSPPGMVLPAFSVVELWYVTGTTGSRVTIVSARLVTEATDPYFEVLGEAGQLNPGARADVVVKLTDANGNPFVIRTANVPVQRYERLE